MKISKFQAIVIFYLLFAGCSRDEVVMTSTRGRMVELATFFFTESFPYNETGFSFLSDSLAVKSALRSDFFYLDEFQNVVDLHIKSIVLSESKYPYLVTVKKDSDEVVEVQIQETVGQENNGGKIVTLRVILDTDGSPEYIWMIGPDIVR